MSFTTVSIAWAFLQISLLCLLALSAAWALRGRRPQLVSAILAGTCLASLLLAIISLVPPFQWTLAIEASAPTFRPTEVPIAEPNTDTSARSEQTKAIEPVGLRQLLNMEQSVASNQAVGHAFCCSFIPSCMHYAIGCGWNRSWRRTSLRLGK